MPEEEFEHCPKCGKDLHYTPEDKQGTVFSHLIGVEIRGVYDGVLYWLCPFCDIAFHRWPDGHPYNEKAQRFIDQHNLGVLKEKG